MAFSGNSGQADLPYVIGDLLIQANRVFASPRPSLETVDVISLALYAYMEPYTEDDQGFQEGWRTIQVDREATPLKNGFEDYTPGAEGFEDVDLAFRFREFGAMIRAGVRLGVIAKIPSPRSRWVPPKIGGEDETELEVEA